MSDMTVGQIVKFENEKKRRKENTPTPKTV